MLTVDDQAQKFANDALLRDLSARPVAIRFGGCPHAKEAERRHTFLDGCLVARRLFVVIPQNGLNFDLNLQNVRMMDNGEVEFESVVSMDGVCVRWRASINKNSLSGVARLEFDAQTARQLAQSYASFATVDDADALHRRIANLRDAILYP